ncbi:MAG: dTDP-4-dehydrorhamnose 3,5-epimerase [Methanoregulaceae archaeon]|jgi:dTDP-4-dehydrorhamnose 3,5-epimerase|nr:dTDP-4-dehydrorhamnose 3,5-epimerase [Methanoregulaceae archaeon]
MTGKFSRHPLKLPEITLIKPVIFRDTRGFFLESYNKSEFEKIGIITNYVQDNHSCSEKGVIRGLHFQSVHPQEKLIRVVSGSVYDVVVDIRKGSPHFGMYVGVYLSDKDMTMIHIPAGFAHGFLSMEANTHVHYKTSEFYYPEHDSGIRWNDPDIGINWPLDESGIGEPIISEKDSNLPRLRDMKSPFSFEGTKR